MRVPKAGPPARMAINRTCAPRSSDRAIEAGVGCPPDPLVNSRHDVRSRRRSGPNVARACGAAGARFLGMEEVRGSIPLRSTTIDTQQAQKGSFCSHLCSPHSTRADVDLTTSRRDWHVDHFLILEAVAGWALSASRWPKIPRPIPWKRRWERSKREPCLPGKSRHSTAQICAESVRALEWRKAPMPSRWRVVHVRVRSARWLRRTAIARIGSSEHGGLDAHGDAWATPLAIREHPEGEHAERADPSDQPE